ncbi:hypothetical protein [[Phormidium] sp. ETS-05]|nr:hypothetical protein [[Phormidium] sp. ETS-05]
MSISVGRVGSALLLVIKIILRQALPTLLLYSIDKEQRTNDQGQMTKDKL